MLYLCVSAKKLMIPNLVELLSGKDSDNCDKRWRETYFMLRNYKKKVEHFPIVSNQTFKEYSGFQADDIISHFQSQKGYCFIYCIRIFFPYFISVI